VSGEVAEPEGRVHWIGEDPYFGVVYPVSALWSGAWGWKLYDFCGKQILKGEAQDQEAAQFSVQDAAHLHAKNKVEKIWPKED
jgi:hypothetical protein